MLVFDQLFYFFGGIKNPSCWIPFSKILSISRFREALNAPVANGMTALEIAGVA